MEKLKNQHINVALFFFLPHFTAHRCSVFVIICSKSNLEFIRIIYFYGPKYRNSVYAAHRVPICFIFF